jgi:hypothetical protein
MRNDMNKFKPALVLLLVFVAGTVFGVVGTRMVVRSVIREVIKHPNLAQERIELNLVKRLKLNPEQKAKVHEVLVDSQKQIRPLRIESMNILSNAQVKIWDILTEEQRRQFDKMKEENRNLLRPPPA